MGKLSKEQVDEFIEQCTGEMAYRLFLERESEFGNVFEQARQMVAWGYTPEQIVDNVISGLSGDNKKYAEDNPHVRTLLIRATEYAATRLDAAFHTAPLN